MYFRRQIKASEYNNKRWLNEVSSKVRCEGKQIHN